MPTQYLNPKLTTFKSGNTVDVTVHAYVKHSIMELCIAKTCKVRSYGSLKCELYGDKVGFYKHLMDFTPITLPSPTFYKSTHVFWANVKSELLNINKLGWDRILAFVGLYDDQTNSWSWLTSNQIKDKF